MTLIHFILLSIFFTLSSASCKEDRKKFIFYQSRDRLLKAETEYEKRNFLFDENTRHANNYLQHLKRLTIQRNEASITANTFTNIKHLHLYHLLRKMPKGAILHTHENHQLSKLKLLKIALNSDQSNNLYMNTMEEKEGGEGGGIENNHPWKVLLTDQPSNDLVKVKDVLQSGLYSLQDIADRMTLQGQLKRHPNTHPHDSRERWRLANKAFASGSSGLLRNAEIKKEYLREVWMDALHEGVIYMEGRKSTSHLLRDLHMSEELLADFQLENPNFLGYKRIYYSKRTEKQNKILNDLEIVKKGLRKHPEHVLGFDLVGDEDYGQTFNHHLAAFLNHSVIETDPNGQERLRSSIPLYLHTAETNWNENFHIKHINSPHDPTPNIQNLYSALLLGVKRIGHGIGFWKHPHLMNILKEEKIPIEVCVVSNKLLGYTSDLKEHPGQLFHKEGIPVVLSPDDPGLFGYDEVTVDWFHAFLTWGGLNIGDLYQFGLNSLLYSGMNASEKENAIEKNFKPAWKAYVAELSKEACNVERRKGLSWDVVQGDGLNEGRGVSVDIDGGHDMCGMVKCSYQVVDCGGLEKLSDVKVVEVVTNGSLHPHKPHLIICPTPLLHQLLNSQHELEDLKHQHSPTHHQNQQKHHNHSPTHHKTHRNHSPTQHQNHRHNNTSRHFKQTKHGHFKQNKSFENSCNVRLKIGFKSEDEQMIWLQDSHVIALTKDYETCSFMQKEKMVEVVSSLHPSLLLSLRHLILIISIYFLVILI